jgi:CRISPR-associated protein Cas2
MRKVYIVTYDISDPKRLRQVFKLMMGYGDHLQLSVFECELNARELVELRHALGELIHHDQDQVLFVDVGAVEGRGADSITSLGRHYSDPERTAIVV